MRAHVSRQPESLHDDAEDSQSTAVEDFLHGDVSAESGGEVVPQPASVSTASMSMRKRILLPMAAGLAELFPAPRKGALPAEGGSEQ
jgi:hypothetical protein